ncbi:glutathione S-transferase [Enhydrobacter aerosaccus]|uniref:Glutathione S-transferase n=1 Tax=Enhydrobacter aerosaccus TaxID=225324 RepID=A0A1T4TMS3_9HYPH|nr:glutathione transferase GstA [Enhydrobacter aerosaccus]SKA41783.1 glutathione S-transferase [Enhydrobacter aerosaccus]
MKLYLTPHACSLAVDIVARELEIPLSLEWVDVRAKRLRDGSDYFAVNPKGQVPTLELDSGERLTEGPVIVQYLADRRPGTKLLGAPGTMERYRVLEWLNFVSSELHKGFTPLFRPNTPAEYRQIARQNLHIRFQWLNDHLAGREFLTGPTFTVADAYCYTIVMWTKLHDIDISSWPNLKAYVERVATRASVIAAEQAERDAKAA